MLDLYDKGTKFVLYTGRGPSGPSPHRTSGAMDIHPSHSTEIQNPPLFPNNRRRKIPHSDNADLKETAKWSYENALDLIALGFKPEDTFIIYDTKDMDLLYDITLEVAKRITYSTARSSFGFQDSTNIGWVFWPAIQAAPCFIHKKLTGENVPALIPAAIDQDPYWRVTRDIAQKLGYYKPAQIHCRFLPGLGAGGKMSASMPETSIFTIDQPDVVKKKIWNAFTGGKGTAAEQRKSGADPTVCSIFQYYFFLFEEDNAKLAERERRCRGGEMLCGECKKDVAEKLNKFLAAASGTQRKSQRRNRAIPHKTIKSNYFMNGKTLKKLNSSAGTYFD